MRPKFNVTKAPQRYANTDWKLLRDRGDYQFADLDDMPWETTLGDFDRVLPTPTAPVMQSCLRRC